MLPVLPSPPSPSVRHALAETSHRANWPGTAVEERKHARRIRVLVVEDQPEDVELMLRSLDDGGFDVQADVAQNEDEFLERIHQNAYDVVLADYNLPQWTGLETIELLRREALDVPVIMVSGALGDVKAVECLKQGATDYVLKDHLPRLPETVRGALRAKQLREEKRRAQEELARSNRDLEQFAYVASHDLQEPLRTIATYTQLLAERYRGQLDEEADKYIDYAVDGAIRMQTLIDDLLAFSRVGREGLELQNTDCNVAMEVVKRNLQAAVQESGAQIEYQRLPVVIADNSLLTLVFQNLVGNGIKFHGKNSPHVRVTAEKINLEWIFSVADNGIGIAHAHAQAIFSIFKRLHTHAEYPGSGIGLSICKKVIEQHGGRIWVESSPGQGATFKFSLPAVAERRRYE